MAFSGFGMLTGGKRTEILAPRNSEPSGLFISRDKSVPLWTTLCSSGRDPLLPAICKKPRIAREESQGLSRAVHGFPDGMVCSEASQLTWAPRHLP